MLKRVWLVFAAAFLVIGPPLFSLTQPEALTAFNLFMCAFWLISFGTLAGVAVPMFLGEMERDEQHKTTWHRP